MKIQLDEMVRKNRFIRENFSLLMKIAYSDSLTLLSGEEGTEKIYIARLIHELSNRYNSSFISFDCSITPEDSDFPGEYNCRNQLEESWPYLRRAGRGGSIFIDGIDSLGRKGQFYLKSILDEQQRQFFSQKEFDGPAIRFIL